MITKRSTRQQLREEVDSLRDRLIRANASRAEEFERWALRCRELKTKNEEQAKELEWLRDQRVAGQRFRTDPNANPNG